VQQTYYSVSVSKMENISSWIGSAPSPMSVDKTKVEKVNDLLRALQETCSAAADLGACQKTLKTGQQILEGALKSILPPEVSQFGLVDQSTCEWLDGMELPVEVELPAKLRGANAPYEPTIVYYLRDQRDGGNRKRFYTKKFEDKWREVEVPKQEYRALKKRKGNSPSPGRKLVKLDENGQKELLLKASQLAAQVILDTLTKKNPVSSDISIALVGVGCWASRSLVGRLGTEFTATLTEFGTSGAYALAVPGKADIGVFKPYAEEVGKAGNPRGLTDGTRYPLCMENSHIRERVAYLLKGRTAVPPTILAEVSHPSMKVGGIGSLQKWVVNAGASTNSDYNDISVDDVHDIGILDLRIYNVDRNPGNVLITMVGAIPIDHGNCLPNRLGYPASAMAWMAWPQAKVPFSPDHLEMIEGIDVDGDDATLKTLGIEEGARVTKRRVTNCLKEGARKGMSLYAIGACVYREDPDSPAMLELP